jgi:hypothetical protein
MTVIYAGNLFPPKFIVTDETSIVLSFEQCLVSIEGQAVLPSEVISEGFLLELRLVVPIVFLVFRSHAVLVFSIVTIVSFSTIATLLIDFFVELIKGVFGLFSLTGCALFDDSHRTIIALFYLFRLVVRLYLHPRLSLTVDAGVSWAGYILLRVSPPSRSTFTGC